MTQHPFDFQIDPNEQHLVEGEDMMSFPDISYVCFDDCVQAVLDFYDEQNHVRAQARDTLVPNDLLAAWDRAKQVR